MGVADTYYLLFSMVCYCYCYYDRFGFQESPKLELVAKPKLGQREVTLSYVTDWIEKKLCEVVEVCDNRHTHTSN